MINLLRVGRDRWARRKKHPLPSSYSARAACPSKLQLNRAVTPYLLLVALACCPRAFAVTFDLATAGIPEIQAAVDSGALTYEKLVQLYLARIAAYDQQGPALNTVITLNPKA